MLTNTVRDIQSDKDLADVKPGMFHTHTAAPPQPEGVRLLCWLD
jgi:hypothetical protein